MSFKSSDTLFGGELDRMTSIRTQSHLIFAPNGDLYAVIQRGNVGSAGETGLIIMKSTDEGATWTFVFQLFSGSDLSGSIILSQNFNMYIVAGTLLDTAAASHDFAFWKLTWNGSAWTVGSLTLIANASATESYSHPVIAQDSSGTLWAAARFFDSTNYVVKVFYSTDEGATWSDSTQMFGSSSTDTQKYPHFAINNGNKLGLLVMDELKLKWYVRNDSDSETAAWSAAVDVDDSEVGSYPYHYTTFTDRAGDVHLVYQLLGGGDKYYRKYSGGVWGARETWSTLGSYQDVYAIGDIIYAVGTNNNQLFLKKRVNGSWLGFRNIYSGDNTRRPKIAKQHLNEIHIIWQENSLSPFVIRYGIYKKGGKLVIQGG